MDHLNNQEKRLLQDMKQEEKEEGLQDEETANGVFWLDDVNKKTNQNQDADYKPMESASEELLIFTVSSNVSPLSVLLMSQVYALYLKGD